jgi:hypothetical protein
MTSIFTGLAFMHGHIVDRELLMRLGAGRPPVRPPDPPTAHADLTPTAPTSSLSLKRRHAHESSPLGTVVAADGTSCLRR